MNSLMGLQQSTMSTHSKIASGNSQLLGLSLEVFQHILRQMDPATFFASIMTCKSFMVAAGSSKDLISHKIRKLPGIVPEAHHLSMDRLFLLFRQRAAQSGCAARVLADVERYVPAPGTSLTTSAFSTFPDKCSSPSLTPLSYPASDNTVQLAVAHKGGMISVYELGRPGAYHKTILFIHPEDENDGKIEILCIAFSRGSKDMAVIYEILDHKRNLDVGPFRLVMFHRLYEVQQGFTFDSDRQEARVVDHPTHARPVGFALASNGNACIAWKYPCGSERTTVTTIGRNAEVTKMRTYDENPPQETMDPPNHWSSFRAGNTTVFNLEYAERDKKINLFESGLPIHSWYAESPNFDSLGMTAIRPNTSRIDINKDGKRKHLLISSSFHGSHNDVSPRHGTKPCHKNYLSLGISTSLNESGQPCLYILQTMPRSGPCNHVVDLDEGRKHTRWRARALLAGYRQGTSTLGTVLAISPRGTRVAAANWSQVLIWSFDPSSLQRGKSDQYFPREDFNPRKDLGRLRPTPLSSEGVVHRMLWTSERHLFAVTDHGLVKWDLGHMSQGKRRELTLAHD